MKFFEKEKKRHSNKRENESVPIENEKKMHRMDDLTAATALAAAIATLVLTPLATATAVLATETFALAATAFAAFILIRPSFGAASDS